MKVHLLYADRDFDPEAALAPNTDELTQDLGLDIVFAAMAGGDRFIHGVARTGTFASLTELDLIRYRQAILADCLEHPTVIRQLYALAVEGIDRERKIWAYTARFPDSLLHRSVDVLKIFVDILTRLRTIAYSERWTFRSEGFQRLFDEIVAELGDDYLHAVQAHLDRLAFRDGVLVSAELGAGNRGRGYMLRRRVGKRTWRERIGLAEPGTYVWQLPDRDEAGSRALSDLKGRGIALAADALAHSTDHILSYFVQLRAELGFYIACLNLRDRLAAKGEPLCLPEPRPAGEPWLGANGLYDVALSLSMNGASVRNDLAAEGKRLLVITGANRGGKSTALRSLGLAQLMMQAGMFVAAQAFEADIRDGLFTHFRREEDVNLRSGKLDEELGRMSWIVDRVGSTGLLLLNESFASTNEREGSEIARQIVHALIERGVKVIYVTHMFDLAEGFHREQRSDALFLRAERLPDGRRTFRIIPGEPLPTSHGVDVYRRIFGEGTVAGPQAERQPAAS
jgi:hypothetical protein